MRKTLILFLAIASQVANAQIASNFYYSNAQTAGDKDTIYISLTNNYNIAQTIFVGDAVVYYSDTVFKPLTSQVQLDAGETKQLGVVCYSQHNMKHAYALALETSDFGVFGVQLYNEVSYTQSRYNGTYNKSGEALKAALKTAAQQGHNSLGYNTARDRMYMNIDNQKITQGATVNTLEGVYTGQVISNYSNRSAAQNMGFNTEHTFPQGFFSSNEPMKSDIFHLYPTNSNANSQRGNLPFGVVSNASWSQGGSKKGNSKFEPRDVHKGNVARAMMYFVIRYQDYSGHFASQEAILRTWNESYPVTTLEADRNDAINQYQGNRNPFIDYPQFAERFTSFTANGDLPTSESVELSSTSFTGTGGHVFYAFFRNTGTTTVNISDFNVDNTSAFAIDTTGDAQVLPGEGVLFEITFQSTTSNETGTLSITTDDNAGSYSIDLTNEAASSVGAYKLNEDVKLFPVPAKKTLCSSSSLVDVSITNASGTIVLETSGSATSWNVSSLSSGLYYLNGADEKGRIIRTTFIKK